MSETYNLFQQGRAHLREGMAAQATVPLEKAKRREPEKASIREALQRDWGIDVEKGVFGAYMELELVNDGPVTIVLEI